MVVTFVKSRSLVHKLLRWRTSATPGDQGDPWGSGLCAIICGKVNIDSINFAVATQQLLGTKEILGAQDYVR